MPSALLFDEAHPEVQAFARARGWEKPGRRVAVYQAELVYSADGWKSTHAAPLRYLARQQQGFLLPELEPGAAITFAVHAFLGASDDGFYSFAEKAETWVNNGGKNHAATTASVPER